MPTRKSKDFSDEELLQPVKEFFEKYGKAPRTIDYTKDNGFSFGYNPAYNKRFIGIQGINKAAGITSNNTKTYTRKSIIEIIQPVADFLGRCPKYNEVKEYSKICKNFPGCFTVENAFDNWEDLAHSLGYSVNRRTIGTTKQQLYDIYKPVSDKKGKCITKDEVIKLNVLDKEKYPGHSVIKNIFKTWENFANYLGFERNCNPKGFWSEGKCLAAIEPEANIRGRALFSYEFNELSNNNLEFPSTVTVNLHCGGVDEIATKIGHKPNMKNKSRAELEIVEYVKTLTQDDVYSGDRTGLEETSMEGKELDIYIPDRDIAIEYNGLYWHSQSSLEEKRGLDAFGAKNYHLHKSLAAYEKGIKLIHVFENEWELPHKREIVKSRLRNIFGQSERIFARKTEVREIQNDEAKPFLDETHIQGYIPASFKCGLYYDGWLIAVMTFGKSRYNKKENAYELLRYSTEHNINVVGGASKLLKFFLRQTPTVNFLVSYADLRWSSFEGSVYHKLGFTYTHRSKPNYFYFENNSLNLFSRVSYQKHKLIKYWPDNFDSSLTEYDNCLANGLYRIWDCGNLVYEMEINNENPSNI